MFFPSLFLSLLFSYFLCLSTSLPRLEPGHAGNLPLPGPNPAQPRHGTPRNDPLHVYFWVLYGSTRQMIGQ